MDTQSTRFMRVALIGAIANPNVGDEAILEENIRLVDSMFGTHKMVYVFSKDASYTSLTSLGDITAVDYLHRLTLRCNFEIDRVRDLCQQAIDYVPGSGLDTDFEAIHQILSNIDVLHIIGGGYLNSKWPDMIEEVRVAAVLAHRYGARVIATGIGIYPMSGREFDRFADVIDLCEFVDFRDESVGQLPEELRTRFADKLGVTTDDAVAYARLAPERWLAHVPHEVKSAATGSYLNVALHNTEGIRGSGIVGILMKSIDHLYAKGAIDRVNFLGFYPGDLDLLRGLDEVTATACPMEKLEMWRYPAYATAYLVSRATANIGSRYHQAVFSLAAGVPTLSLSIDAYYTYKLEAIHGNVGSDRIIPIADASLDDLLRFADSLEEIRGSLSHAESDLEALRERKLQKVAQVYSGEVGLADALLDRALDESPVKVSVIVPVSNDGTTIGECLDSILAQSLREIEVVCVDRGSDDGSSEILNDYARRDGRIKVIVQTNAGISAARNAGLKAASGEFAVFVDPQDWLASGNALMSLFWAAKNHGVLCACGGCTEVVVGEGGSRTSPKRVVASWDGNDSGLGMPPEGAASYRAYQYDAGWNRFIFDRHALVSNELWFPDRVCYGDVIWFTRVMDLVGDFWAMTIPVYCYRRAERLTPLPAAHVVDLLRGLIDVLEFSSARGYDLLWSLTCSRLTHDFAPHIMPLLCAEKPDHAVEGLLERLQALIVEGGGTDRLERAIIRNGERLACEDEIAAAREELQAATRELAVAKRELATTEKEFEDAKRGFDVEVADEIARIKSSRTWKVGSAVWWLPRKVRDLMESN